MRRAYQLFRRMFAKATLRNLRTTLQVLYPSLKSDREFRFALFFALISTLVWWYLHYRWARMVVDNDPYEVLGLIDLTPPVTMRDIQRAYRSQLIAERAVC
jgi:hypothetical protein